MKTIVKSLSMLLLTLFVAAGADARDYNNRVGLGFILGAPSGLDAKIWFSRDTALDVQFGWSYWNVWAQAAYEWHYWTTGKEKMSNQDVSVPLYVGVGGYAGGGRHNAGFGPLGVIGIDILFKKAPFDIFFEMGPAIQIMPETGIFFHGGIGARYYLP